jgi:triosephosphate isomerase (TIM)
MRRKIAAGNWKMNTSKHEAESLIRELLQGTWGDEVEMIVAVPFTHLAWVGEWLGGDARIAVAAQNCHHMSHGAYTGEVSASMVVEAGAKYVILGHSERREYFDESDDLVNSKIRAALDNGLRAIFCLGEPLEIRQADGHVEYVLNQLERGLRGISLEEMDQLVIAYEPIWAIGTGVTASPDQAEEMHEAIRSRCTRWWGARKAAAIPILYGGSVKASNAHELFGQRNIDGGLIGGASLDAKDFLEIAKSF